MKPVRLLHIFSTFAPGGPQVRTVDLMNALGVEFDHTVIAMDNVTTAAARVFPEVGFRLLGSPRAESTLATAQAVRGLLRRHRPDVMLTYNWGAIEAAMGARWAGCPLIHAEDGFGPEEATRRLPRRIWTRRLVLRGAKATVVPSRTLERIALSEYRLPPARVLYIPNGIDLSRFAPGRRPDVAVRLGLTPGVPVIGAVGHLRAEKNLPLMLRAFARLEAGQAQLLLVGDGPCRSELESLAGDLGCAGRTCWAGSVQDTAPLYGAMDLFAMSSSTEQMPVALLEAMGSGLPAVCTDVGDCAAMLGSGERPFIVPAGEPEALAASFAALLRDHAGRARAGENNRQRCQSLYDRASMIRHYRELYLSSIGVV